MDAISTLIENGDKVGSYSLLLIFIGLLLWGLSTGRVAVGPQLKEKDEALKEANNALAIANKELSDTKFELLKLQLERELLWRNQSITTIASQVQPGIPQKGDQ